MATLLHRLLLTFLCVFSAYFQMAAQDEAKTEPSVVVAQEKEEATVLEVEKEAAEAKEDKAEVQEEKVDVAAKEKEVAEEVEKAKEEIVTEEAAKVEVEEKEVAEEVKEVEPAIKEEKAEAILIEPAEKKEVVAEVESEKKPEEVAVVPEVPEKKEEEVEIIGIDTVDLAEPQGNWLFKRMWWERAEEKYDKIRRLVDTIFQARMEFFEERNKLDKNVLDPFYIHVGLGQGELSEILRDLIERIEEEREEEGFLNEREREFLTLLRGEKKVLEQVQRGVDAISKLDEEIDKGLNELMEQINQVRKHEHEAWQSFKDIARVLNDKKARELFYKMDTASKNISEIAVYIAQRFKTHFQQHLIENARKQVERITSAIQALREKGIDFKKQAERLDLEEEIVAPKPEKERKVVQEEPAQGWLAQIASYLAMPFKALYAGLEAVWSGLVYVVRLPIDMLFGPAEKDLEQGEQDVAEGRV